MTIELLKLKDATKWDDFVSRRKDATFYHQIGYRFVIEKSFKHRADYLVAKEKNRWQGVLPLFLIKGKLLPTALVSLPFTGYGGALAKNEKAKKALLKKAKKLGAQLKVDYLLLRTKINQPKKDYKRATLILKIGENESEIFQKFDKKTRNLIRKARGFNLTSEVAPKQLDNFYRLWAENRRDLGTPVFTKKFFENLLAEFPGKINFCVIFKNKLPLAGACLISFRDTVEALYAGSPKKYRRLCPNMLLYYQAILWAKKIGFSFFDFSPSEIDTPHFQFKKQFGGAEKVVEYQIFNSKNDLSPTGLKESKKVLILRKIWQKMPLFLANKIGPIIAKEIP